jgi:hypothetical protein
MYLVGDVKVGFPTVNLGVNVRFKIKIWEYIDCGHFRTTKLRAVVFTKLVDSTNSSRCNVNGVHFKVHLVGEIILISPLFAGAAFGRGPI